ncbi:MAG: hypothetical protein JMM76_00315 [Candidatus Xiphinematobacter sp.]|nr:MAG: hypothetical protein JMM76_00315 [Candidatus Xiphinematobacter sp.]
MYAKAERKTSFSYPDILSSIGEMERICYSPLGLRKAWNETFAEKSKVAIVGLVVIGIACVGGGVSSLVAVCQAQRAAEALLANASTVEQLQTVHSRYPRSGAAASALLLLAGEQRRLGRLKESSVTYQKFLAAFPKHSLAPVAALGVAENALASGCFPDGIDRLQALAAKYPVSFVVPFSLYTRAELLTTQAGRIPEARELLRNLTLWFPDSVFSRYSADLLFLLDAQQVKE